jgi:diadenylate cyclase
VIVLFQAEIRTALTHFGQINAPFGLRLRRRDKSDQQIYDEIVLAATTLSTQKIGGLIVLERGVGLQNYIDSGINLNAHLSYDLLVTIFNPHTPLHDGAAIVRNQRIAAASCFLPLTLNPQLSKDLGTRHRAAIGITEDSDAVAVVISEETGVISFVKAGQIKRNLDGPRLRAALQETLGTGAKTTPGRTEAARPLARAATERVGPTPEPPAGDAPFQPVRKVKDAAEEYDRALS